MPDVRKLERRQTLGNETRLLNSALGKFSVVDTLLGVALFPVPD
jgi:hypothetical protein